MTDHKHPALLAAERWFATEQAKSDLVAARSMTVLERGAIWVEETLRGLARIAFVVGYEAGRKARGESVAAFIDGEARRFDAASKNSVMGATDSADRCSIKAGHSRTLAAQVARGDDENAPA